MAAIVIIPARYGSTRLEGKVLLAETGKPLIQHVVESTRLCASIDRVVVATDDQRVFSVVQGFGGEAIITSDEHRCGTDRIAEAVSPGKLDLPDEQVVVNVQGDEPEIPPECVDKLVELIETTDAPMATLAAPLAADQAEDPSKVKVVLNRLGEAMYFSRAKIPHDRDGDRQAGYLLHIGIYAYRVGFLKVLTSLPPTPAEQAEKLEQLRALESGYKIAVAVVDYCGCGIDTPQDYAEFVARIKQREAGPVPPP